MKAFINKNPKYKWILFLLLVIQLSGCEKFLDEKPDLRLVVPETLTDAQAIMDYYSIFNSSYPSLGDQSDDNFYTTDTRFNAMTLIQRTLYSWGLEPITDNEYAALYRIVLNATIALETVNKVERNNNNAILYDQVKGTALFYRAYALIHAAQYFSEPYDATLANQKKGIAIRPTSNVEELSVRINMKQSWEHIALQLEEAALLLPISDIIPSRPNKAAAWAALARVKMAMHQYEGCREASKQSLMLYKELIDFNTLNANATSPISRFNKEVIFPATSSNATQLNPANYSLDTLLYASYNINDLRRTVYFRNNNFGGKSFKANLNGNANGVPFSGIATDEVYLMFAESAARTERWQEGIDSLNSLLKTRWKQGTFIPFTANNKEQAIEIILIERRKELILRGTRWFDLRRFSKEPLYAVSPKRVIEGVQISLTPTSKRYTFYIPQEVVNISGMEQNER